MSIGSILGLLVGLGLFVGSILLKTDNLLLFWDASSIVLVLGGTLSASFLGYQARYVNMALRDLLTIFFSEPVARGELPQTTAKIIKWAKINQARGLAALEKELKNADSPFLEYGAVLVVSGYSSGEVRDMMSQAARAQLQRQSSRFDILRNMGGTAPAFGMIGTLVGLVIMLDTLADDPAGVGAGLAVALLTTLYGVMFARLIFMPAASKLQQRAEIQMFLNYLITEGLAMIADGASSREIADKMNSYLDPVIHISPDGHMVSAGKGKAKKGKKK